MSDRSILLLAVTDYAYSILHDGESAPDYRGTDSAIDDAAKRYKVTLTPQERAQVTRRVQKR